jgi:hypothetical protein
MDSKRLKAALRRLEYEQFGRTFNVPGVDAAAIGEWMWWMRDLDIKPENLRSHTHGEQEQPEPVRIVDAAPDGAKHSET